MKTLYKADKITAAGCQLDTAIELIFRAKDMLSAAVLVHGAWNIAKDLLIKNGGESSRKWISELFPELKENEVYKNVHEVWNFCKHANDDPDKIIQFSSEYVEGALILALYDFAQISPIKSKTMDVYELWFVAKNEELFKSHPEVLEGALEIFPNLSALSPEDQLIAGFKVISAVC